MASECGIKRSQFAKISCQLTGYSSSPYFAETFKKYACMTPTEYRNFVPELDAIMQSNWDHPEWRTPEEEQRRATVFKGAGKARRK